MESFSTRSIVLSSWLAYNGREADSMKLLGSSEDGKPFVVWNYESVDADCSRLIEAFESGEAAVEPLRFTKVKNQVRGQLNEFTRNARHGR